MHKLFVLSLFFTTTIFSADRNSSMPCFGVEQLTDYMFSLCGENPAPNVLALPKWDKYHVEFGPTEAGFSRGKTLFSVGGTATYYQEILYTLFEGASVTLDDAISPAVYNDAIFYTYNVGNSTLLSKIRLREDISS